MFFHNLVCIYTHTVDYRLIMGADDQALNRKWQISLPVVPDMLTLIAIMIICLSHGSSFASMNNKLVFLRICYLLLCSIFVITAYKNTRYVVHTIHYTYIYMIRKSFVS